MNISSGIFLRCDEHGMVDEILQDTLGLALSPGVPFSRLSARGNLDKALSFLQEIREKDAAFGCEINIGLNEKVKTVQFAGCKSKTGILIVGADNNHALEELYTEMLRINNDQVNALRSTIKGQRDNGLFDEISRLNNELVAAQRELAKKNAELARLNEEKNRFLGMAAHDLRNPLHNILSASTFLSEEEPARLGRDYHEFIAMIISSSHFMANLIDDLLDVAKIETGRLQLDYSPQDLTQLLQQNVARNQALATKKAITIELNSASLPTAVLDASKMEQVLNNLLGNAIKFSPSGSRIKVQLEKADQNFRFSVRDEGPGMTPQEQAVLFTAFKQGRTGTQGEKSTGLGLVIVKRIVEGHGGKIWFESQSGHGTAFFVEMPILPPEL